jgi:peptide/nickel transport system permease protein
MMRYLGHRIWQSAITVLLAMLVVFVGVRLLPGDPGTTMSGQDATPDQVASLNAKLGLDQPILVQFVKFVGNAITGELGTSVRTGAPVSEMIASTLPITLQLSLLAMIVAFSFGTLSGIVASTHQGRWQEWVSNGMSLAFLSVPSFWLGLLAITYLAVGLGWFPASGYVAPSDDLLGSLYHLALPAIVLGAGLAAVIMRQTRSAMLDSLSSDYVRTARARGLSRTRTTLRYAYRNSLLVVITLVGLQLGTLISGAVVTESIFGLPGFGKLTLNAVFTRDYPVIQGVVLVVAVFYVVINLGIDVLYTLINPRIRVRSNS